jgi:hypothetical protein
MATFLHLGFERSPEFGDGDITGGYAELMNAAGSPVDALHGKYDVALRTGVTPHHVMPAVFVPEDHPHYIFNGIRDEVIVGIRAAGQARSPVLRAGPRGAAPDRGADGRGTGVGGGRAIDQEACWTAAASKPDADDLQPS